MDEVDISRARGSRGGGWRRVPLVLLPALLLGAAVATAVDLWVDDRGTRLAIAGAAAVMAVLVWRRHPRS